MNSKRSYQDGNLNVSYPKRPMRSFDSTSNDDAYRLHNACSAFAHEAYTIAWICALPLELTASRAMLDEEHGRLPIHNDDENTYVLGRADQHNVVMVCLPGGYGTINAAIVATNLKRSFPNIRATLMVGIGGGVPSMADLRLGDVVVGTRVMQYDMGKDIGDGNFEMTGVPKIPGRRLDSVVSVLRSKHGPQHSSGQIMGLLQSRLPDVSRPNGDRLFQASYEHPPGAPNGGQTCDSCDPEMLIFRGERPSEEPRIHYGVVASGNTVMKNARARDAIARRLDALCFEMEAAGMMDNLQCLPIRGICDYADSHKNKEWQGYAAATAAAYARELLEVLPPIFGEYSFSQINNRKTTIRAACAKTCRWFIHSSAYQDWLNPEKQSQNHGFLWMRGKAGAGKSTMMKFLYLDSKKREKKEGGLHATTASFFFNARGDYLEKSITGMYRSLLLQLLRSFSDLQSVLDDTDIVPRSQQDCPNLSALKELLRSAVMGLNGRSFTCFIDALDECDEQEVREMVQFFGDLAENTAEAGAHFRICFSSRPYPYINIRKGILLTLEDECGHREDLVQYVRNNLIIEDPPLLADLQSQILDKAAGIFLWIVLVVDILKKEEDEGGLALRKKLSEIPAELSNLFKSILIRDQNKPEQLQLCILWILCAKRPLTPTEFRHALWVALLDRDREQNDHQVDLELSEVKNINACVKLVTTSSKGLAEITKSNQPTVQFIHESVRDFLVKEKGLQNLWPDLGFDWEGRSHERLKRYCTTYLSLPGVQAMINEPEDGDEQSILAEKYSLSEYASQQVLYHADAAALMVPQDDFLSEFFTSALMQPLSTSWQTEDLEILFALK
ncbi:hypothetical protein S7711_03087 [Stachybotrys chartarum IBT 7711]|uniref:Uncharacterized protein n=1 Tax=Stachybotrys chartarum (strain CBS 109288 / IBT 7711) TaxID=1280523 RepID=A0A084B8A1_STACB|nr:hypothetical protein S7711_03087 [Stachybotrys chartarum IBT 7711]KFA54071.1 hypothetical protein S40293_05555 [Stachybotrys chartarum IBT 40293]